MRVALGVAVFAGMLGVTIFGILFTPVFYFVIRWFSGSGKKTGAALSELDGEKIGSAHAVTVESH
jgi:hypothetical protein